MDTYDTFGSHTGIRSAVRATGGEGPVGIRLDSNLTRENVWRARRLLDALGASQTRIYVSGGMDEHAIAELGDAPVDGYGIGERIVTIPDAPVGVGAVGKITMVGERPSMKLSRGSAKATLPGRLQCWRTPAGDIVGLQGEDVPGQPLLRTVWDDTGRRPTASPSEARDHAAAELAARGEQDAAPIRVTDGLATLVEACVAAASTT